MDSGLYKRSRKDDNKGVSVINLKDLYNNSFFNQKLSTFKLFHTAFCINCRVEDNSTTDPNAQAIDISHLYATTGTRNLYKYSQNRNLKRTI